MEWGPQNSETTHRLRALQNRTDRNWIAAGAGELGWSTDGPGASAQKAADGQYGAGAMPIECGLLQPMAQQASIVINPISRHPDPLHQHPFLLNYISYLCFVVTIVFLLS